MCQSSRTAQSAQYTKVSCLSPKYGHGRLQFFLLENILQGSWSKNWTTLYIFKILLAWQSQFLRDKCVCLFSYSFYVDFKFNSQRSIQILLCIRTMRRLILLCNLQVLKTFIGDLKCKSRKLNTSLPPPTSSLEAQEQ